MSWQKAEEAFEAYWERRGHVERLRDKKDLMGLNKGRNVADFSKPSDFIVSSKVDRQHFAEVKSTTHATRFSFSHIRPAQNAAALKNAKRGDGSYTFYIFSYHLGKWFTMTGPQYRMHLDAGKRSVTFEELDPWQM